MVTSVQRAVGCDQSCQYQQFGKSANPERRALLGQSGESSRFLAPTDIMMDAPLTDLPRW